MQTLTLEGVFFSFEGSGDGNGSSYGEDYGTSSVTFTVSDDLELIWGQPYAPPDVGFDRNLSVATGNIESITVSTI